MVKKILAVDDDHKILSVLKKELEANLSDVEVIAVDGGLEALKHILTGTVDLLITDIAMPDMDGYELYLRAKEQNEKLPVIMITGFGYDPRHTVVNARKAGLKEILFKPFDTDHLISLVKEHLEEDDH